MYTKATTVPPRPLAEHRLRGVTLVELLVALVVVVLTAAYALPGFQTVLANDRQTSTVNRLIASVLLARSIAATQGVVAVLCPSTDGVSCEESTHWSTGWLVLKTQTRHDHPLEHGEYEIVRVEAPTTPLVLETNRTAFRFRPNGKRATNGTAVFCTPHATKPRALIISYNGRPRASDVLPNGSPISCVFDSS